MAERTARSGGIHRSSIAEISGAISLVLVASKLPPHGTLSATCWLVTIKFNIPSGPEKKLNHFEKSVTCVHRKANDKGKYSVQYLEQDWCLEFYHG